MIGESVMEKWTLQLLLKDRDKIDQRDASRG